MPVWLAEDAIAARSEELQAAVRVGVPVDWPAEYQLLLERHHRLSKRLSKVLAIADRYQAVSHELVERLERVGERFRQWRELGLPLCRYCHTITIDETYQTRAIAFIKHQTESGLAQGICARCLEARYGEIVDAQPPQPPPPLPARRNFPSPNEDAILQRARALLADSTHAGHPLSACLMDLVERQIKLARRLNKLAYISDHFQSQLRDSNLRLEHTARTDMLTGLLNRQAMRCRLDDEFMRTRRHGGSLAVLALDLDHFKQVNDSYGHDAGDAVLVYVATAMLRYRRTEDACGRWGGEEFLILLPACNTEQALQVAERLRVLIAQEQVWVHGQAIAVTASFGVAGFILEDTVEDLLRRADQAMYAAKRNGRNRVMQG